MRASEREISMATLFVGGGRYKVCDECVRQVLRREPDLKDADLAQRLPYEEDRYCAGVYAGVWCRAHWQSSGYRRDLPDVAGGLSEYEIEATDYVRD